MDNTFDTLQTHVIILQTLLEHREPGLITWHEAVARQWKAIVTLWEGEE